MSKSLVALFAVVAALAMIVAGCGSSGDSTESTSSLTKAEFVKNGNAICAKGNKAIQAEFEEFAEEKNLPKNKEPSKAVLTEAAEEIVIPQISTEIDELRELSSPSGEEQKVDAIFTAAEEGLEKGEEDPISLTSGSSDSFHKADKLANEYGLTKCGEE